MAQFTLEMIATVTILPKHCLDLGMVDRAFIIVTHQILLADIGNIGRLTIFGKKVVKRLILARAHFLGDRLIPFIGIVEDRVDIKHDTAKIKKAVADNRTNTKIGRRHRRRGGPKEQRLVGGVRLAHDR
jgi:hypothetical protein